MEKKYISVLTLNQYIKAKFSDDGSLQNIYIKGEISNYRPHHSGHIYFTLKDEKSRIQAVMFSSHARNLDFKIENGMQVLIHGYVSVYETTGQYQLYITSMEQDGIGQLFLKYEKLKNKLLNEGLFDQQYKKEIPKFPKAIAVLSAKGGAALRDVCKTIQLRFPFVRVIVFPIPVQGESAYKEIISTLKKVDTIGFDSIILARGGGSIEDLWNFNEEELARCIFDLKTPLICGVGHETDFTICDFVADYRAATPTAAAIIATPDQYELKKYNEQLFSKLLTYYENYINFKELQLNSLKKSYMISNPEYLYANEILRLSQCQTQLSQIMEMFYLKEHNSLDNKLSQLNKTYQTYLLHKQNMFDKEITRLDDLSPLKIMKRGYSLVKKEGVLIKSTNQLHTGDYIEIMFEDGKKDAQIK